MERFIEKELGSAETEAKFKNAHSIRKGLSGLLGLPKKSIKFEEAPGGNWKVNIKGSLIDIIVNEQSGVMQIRDGDEWKTIKKAEDITNPFIEEGKSLNIVKLKINKKKFNPLQHVVNQTNFRRDEEDVDIAKPKKKLETLTRVASRELTKHQNLLAFVVGGASVALIPLVASGNAEAAKHLSEILINSGKWATIVSSIFTSLHPILYLAETKYAKNIDDRGLAKFYKKLRGVTNFISSISAGFAVASIGASAITDNDNSVNKIGAKLHTDQINQPVNTNHTSDPVHTNINPTGINNNNNTLEPPYVSETTQITTPKIPENDIEAWKLYTTHYDEVVSQRTWTNDENGVTLSQVLTHQTLKFLSANGIDPHQVDINHVQDYLTQEQKNLLQEISQTKKVDEYIDIP